MAGVGLGEDLGMESSTCDHTAIVRVVCRGDKDLVEVVSLITSSSDCTVLRIFCIMEVCCSIATIRHIKPLTDIVFIVTLCELNGEFLAFLNSDRWADRGGIP